MVMSTEEDNGNTAFFTRNDRQVYSVQAAPAVALQKPEPATPEPFGKLREKALERVAGLKLRPPVWWIS